GGGLGDPYEHLGALLAPATRLVEPLGAVESDTLLIMLLSVALGVVLLLRQPCPRALRRHQLRRTLLGRTARQRVCAQ
ncbi:MAG: hypothetical protein VXW79_02790, partial [Bacteroidota bacterium]|nr:hypothetical protein [Bacteroidota bacterium]